MFFYFQTTSLKKQQILIAVIIALFTFIVVFLTIGASSLPPQQLMRALLSVIPAIAVGAITFALESIMLAQLERSLHQIRLQFRGLASGEFNTLNHPDSLPLPKEIREVVTNLNHLQQDLSTTFNELQQKLEEQERIRENLQAELMQIQHTVEEQKLGKEDLQSRFNRIQQALEEALEENQALAGKMTQQQLDSAEPAGEVGDFIAHMQGDFQEAPKSVASLTSSSVEEIRQYKEELEYRIAWLRTLLEDAEKELKLICITYEL